MRTNPAWCPVVQPTHHCLFSQPFSPLPYARPPLQENLKCSPAMLSRFDLVFLLLDRPDAERDQRLSEHVMALHSGKEGRAHAARARLLEAGPASRPLLLTDGRGGNGGGGRPPLLERLRVRQRDDEVLPVQVRWWEVGTCAVTQRAEGPAGAEATSRSYSRQQPPCQVASLPPCPTHSLLPQLLRKFIAYARQYVHPRLTGALLGWGGCCNASCMADSLNVATVHKRHPNCAIESEILSCLPATIRTTFLQPKPWRCLNATTCSCALDALPRAACFFLKLAQPPLQPRPWRCSKATTCSCGPPLPPTRAPYPSPPASWRAWCAAWRGTSV